MGHFAGNTRMRARSRQAGGTTVRAIESGLTIPSRSIQSALSCRIFRRRGSTTPDASASPRGVTPYPRHRNPCTPHGAQRPVRRAGIARRQYLPVWLPTSGQPSAAPIAGCVPSRAWRSRGARQATANRRARRARGPVPNRRAGSEAECRDSPGKGSRTSEVVATRWRCGSKPARRRLRTDDTARLPPDGGGAAT